MKKFVLAILYGSLSSFCLAQTASFTYQSSNGLYCNPATINFTQTSSGKPIGFTWIFGNGQVSNLPNPSIVFATAGSYLVKLVVIYDRVAVETSQTIVINPSFNATLTADRNYICTPGAVNFTAAATGNISLYEWSFGDGVTTITPAANVSHNYTAFGSFTAIVKATDAAGCFATASYVIDVTKPPMSGTVNPTEGCIPAPVSFSNTTLLPTGSMITNYNWDYGDGTTFNGSSATSSHTYSVVGDFIPSVSITTTDGCTNTFTYPPVAFGTPPTGLVASPGKTVYCGSETAQFFSAAVNANSYKWDFGDGNITTVKTTSTSHKYSTLGTKIITVTSYFNGCAGASTSFSIDIVGVIAGFTYRNTCGDKRTFSFANVTQGNQSTVTWNFGDGSPTVSSTNAVHTYPASGSFIASLFVTDNITGCTDLYAVTIYTASIALNNIDTAICRNSTTTFTIQNNYTNAGAAYEWNTVGLPATVNRDNPYTVKATIHGNFTTNFVVVNNGPEYCLDTAYLFHPILVRGPNLSFTIPATICANEKLNITNTSAAYLPQDTVKLWYWNYGIVATSNDTTYQPPPISYPKPGLWGITLFAIDNKGCKDSLAKPLTINPIPFLRIIPRDDTLCLGQSDTLIAYHSDNILWAPAGELSCNACDTAIASPTNSTLFFALATNAFGCTAKDSTYIKVYTPFTATPTKSPVFICQSQFVQINAEPPGNVIRWSPSTSLSDTTIYNPLASPDRTTTYIATLTDSMGCYSSTANIDVVVKTLPTVDAGPDQVLPYISPFTITPLYSNNVTQYQWTPAGSLNCVTCPSPSGVANAGETYQIKVTSDSGCVAQDEINILVECKYANIYMPTAFTPNRDDKNDYYYPLARGIKIVKRFIIFDRYGQKVFERQNFKPNEKTSGWNGNYRGQLNTPGSYVYTMEAICETGQTVQKNGTFILLQ